MQSVEPEDLDRRATGAAQQVEPGGLGLGRCLDPLDALVEEVADDVRDVGAGLGQVVGVVGDQPGSLGGAHLEEVREAVDVHAVQRAHGGVPVLGQRDAVPADGVEPGPAGERRTDLEAGGVDDAVEFVVDAADPDARLVDALDTLAVGVDERDVRVVERLQVLVVEARPLAQLSEPRLERIGCAAVADECIDP